MALGSLNSGPVALKRKSLRLLCSDKEIVRDEDTSSPCPQVSLVSNKLQNRLVPGCESLEVGHIHLQSTQQSQAPNSKATGSPHFSG